MIVKSREEAWEMADRFFPTDYMQDDVLSRRAGYPVYISTSINEAYKAAQIADLDCRLEVNDGIQTINIWIRNVEVPEMKATVRSLTGEFEEYTIEQIVSVQYAAGTLIVVYLENDAVKTTVYQNGNTVSIEIH